MQVAVWDTFVKKQDGAVLHFDIIVPDHLKDPEVLFGFGQAYLALRGESGSKLDTEECRFCHIEQPGPEMIEAIERQGYYILEMDDIPAQLPPDPSRRDLVLHLKAHFKEYRFMDFRGKTAEELWQLIQG